MSVFGFFIAPLAETFSVSHGTITNAPIFLIIVPAFFGPIIGRIADRLPIRIVMMVGLCIATGSLYLISLAPTLLYAAFGFAMYVVGMSMCGPIVINSLLIKIYQQDSGRALAIAAMGASLAGITLPKWVAYLLIDNTWRDALASLAGGLFLLLAVVIFFGIPRSSAPLKKRSLNDTADDVSHLGIPVEDTAVEDTAKVVSDSLTTVADKSFLKNRSFWLIGIAVAMTLNAALVLGVCYPPHLFSLGFSMDQAATILAMGGVGGIVGKLCVASVIDKFSQEIKYVASALILIKLLAIIGLMSITSFYPLLIVAFCLGFGGGAFIPMHPILNSCYFDSSIVGKINGAQMPLFLPFALIGLRMLGYSYDLSGHYYWVLLGIVTALFLALILFMCLAKPPRDSIDQMDKIAEPVAG